MEALYGQSDTAALLLKLQELAAHPSVKRELIAVDEDPFVQEQYDRWLPDHLSNPATANDVSTAIKTMLLGSLGC
jgi:hypothetical protein